MQLIELRMCSGRIHTQMSPHKQAEGTSSQQSAPRIYFRVFVQELEFISLHDPLTNICDKSCEKQRQHAMGDDMYWHALWGMGAYVAVEWQVCINNIRLLTTYTGIHQV